MARESSPEIDDELFNEVYGKAYTGPSRSNAGSVALKGDCSKRPLPDKPADEEDQALDPNAVPTDFTSREAKFWEAKAKATERNWKKRKEEEMICKICGESGHFTQGCPTTLGPSRKSTEVFERVPARDKNVRALFSEKVIRQIEKDVGCKLKLDEKFLIVSGKDRLILKTGVDAVHKIIQDNKDKPKSPTSSNRRRSKSAEESLSGSHFKHSGFHNQRSPPSPENSLRLPDRNFNHERSVADQPHHDLHKFSSELPRERDYDNGGKHHLPCPRSPLHPSYADETFRTYNVHGHEAGVHKTNSWDLDRGVLVSDSAPNFDFSTHPQTLEELELLFEKETMDLERVYHQEVDAENYKHREFMRELREGYKKKLADKRVLHKNQWEEFLQLDMQKRHQVHQPSYNQPPFPDYDKSLRNTPYVASNLPTDSRTFYQYPGDNYAAPRPHDAYGEFQHQRHEDFRAYRRY